MPVSAQHASPTIAHLAGPANFAADPRARQFGWLSNRVGVNETLIGLDRDLALFPRLAETMEQTDPKTWRVTLCGGVPFHDGRPMTAPSAIVSLAPLAEERHPARNPRQVALPHLAGLEAVDVSTLVFRTPAPNAAFPLTLTEAGVTVPGPASEAFPINASGHLIFREAIRDQLYRAEANRGHRDGAPALVANGWSRPPIRRAVALPIDRQGIVETAPSGIGGESPGAIFPAVMGWAADIAPACVPAEAKRLLAGSGAV